MGRKVSENEHVDLIEKKQKNGTIYVYRWVSVYSREKGYYVAKEQKLLGKKGNGTGEIIHTRSKSPNGTRKKYASDNKVVGKADVVASRIRFGRSAIAVHDLFRRIGADETTSQGILLGKVARLDGAQVLAYDSSTVSTYGLNHGRARYGYNKDGDGLATDKLFTFYSISSRQPVCYMTVPRNIPDVIAVGNAAKQLEALELGQSKVVSDCGFYSEDNLSLLQASFHFITRAQCDVKWVRPEVDKALKKLEDTGNMCPSEAGTYGICTCLTYEFIKTRKYASRKKGLMLENRRCSAAGCTCMFIPVIPSG